MHKYLIPLLSLTLAACAPTPEEIDDIKKSYSGPSHGFSGLVNIQHADLNVNAPALPLQISVEFERETNRGQHLMLLQSPSRLGSLSPSADLVSLGCNESTDLQELPAFLNVDILKICGNHRIGHSPINITANIIILDNATLEFIPNKVNKGIDRLEIVSAFFWVEGKNNILLQGAEIPGGRTLPPTLNLNAGVVSGDGHLKILSKANIFPARIK